MENRQLLDNFLKQTEFDDENIISLIMYGSRANNTNSELSDLDIFIIQSKQGDYIRALRIGNVMVEAHVYSIHNIYGRILEKTTSNNAYFESLFKTGVVLKDTKDTISMLKLYTDSLDINKRKKHTNSFKMLLSELIFRYNEIAENKSYIYYRILEVIRKTYHYLNDYSYIPVAKVYDIYTNKNKYEDSYCLRIPTDHFTKIFLDAITAKEKDHMYYIKELLAILGISYEQLIYIQDDRETFNYISQKETYKQIIRLNNKREKLVEELVTQSEFSDYFYYNFLYEVKLLFYKIYDDNDQFNYVFDLALNTKDIDERIKIINDIFDLLQEDYKIDFNNYLIKV